jgi:hypothetical protein
MSEMNRKAKFILFLMGGEICPPISPLLEKEAAASSRGISQLLRVESFFSISLLEMTDRANLRSPPDTHPSLDTKVQGNSFS